MSEETSRAFIANQIEHLLLEAADAKDKALLLIMNRIATALDENTRLTRTLTDEFTAHTSYFQEHEKKEMALINQGRGIWRVALGAMLLIQSVGIWWMQGVVSEIAQIKKDVAWAVIEIEKTRVVLNKTNEGIRGE